MKFRYYEKVKSIMCSPDSADEWMEAIYDYGCDYDGESTVKGLQELVDELIDCSHEARKCLKEGKLFRDEDAEERSLDLAIAEKNRHCRRKTYYCPICDKTGKEWTDLNYDFCPDCHHRVALQDDLPLYAYCEHCDFTFLYRGPGNYYICPICGQKAKEKNGWDDLHKVIKETDLNTAKKVAFDTN